eukprot:gene3577-4081_t
MISSTNNESKDCDGSGTVLTSTLTLEQKRRIEENRQRALLRRRAEANRQNALKRLEASKLNGRSSDQPYAKNPGSSTSPICRTPPSRSSKKASVKEAFSQSDNAFQWKERFSFTSSSAKSSHVGAYTASNNQGIHLLEHQKTKYSPVKSNVAGGPAFEVTMVLVNSKRFEAKCSYNADAIGIFKTMSTKMFDMKTKTWNFRFTEYDKLVSALRSVKPEIKVCGVPTQILKLIKELDEKSKNKLEEVDFSKIGEKLAKALMPFQREGVGYGIHNNGRLLIADDMGLGKTIQAISLAYYYKSDWPLLVITPSSVKVSWAKEFQRWIPSLSDDSVNVVHTGRDDPTRGSVNILSYDLLPKHLQRLADMRIRLVIADESHFIKNSKAARTKAALELCKNASRVILLSGTPALSRPSELYTQVSAVNSKLFPGFHSYALRYCDAKKNRFGWDYSGSSNLEELRFILENKIMIRRMKTDVLQQLPEKQRQVVILDSAHVNTKFAMPEAKKLNDASGSERRGALLEYFSATCKAKKQAVMEYVQDLLEGERKFILFAHHQLMLNSITEMLTKKKVSFMRIDGSTTSTARQENVQRFESDPNCLVAVLSITAASTGLTLTSATIVVFAELYWNPGVLVQAEDRVYRIGQKNAVTVVYLLAESTADDEIWPLVQSKLEVLINAGLNQGEFDSEITKFKDSNQMRISDYFNELNDGEDDILSWIDENEKEPLKKRAKIDTDKDFRGKLREFLPAKMKIRQTRNQKSVRRQFLSKRQTLQYTFKIASTCSCLLHYIIPFGATYYFICANTHTMLLSNVRNISGFQEYFKSSAPSAAEIAELNGCAVEGDNKGSEEQQALERKILISTPESRAQDLEEVKKRLRMAEANGNGNERGLDKLTVRFVILSQDAGGIIGKEGSNIKLIIEKSNAQVNITGTAGVERLLNVTGSIEEISNAVCLIAERLEEILGPSSFGSSEHVPPVTLRLLVPNSQCGPLIGKGGSRIKEIREASGATITIPSENLMGCTERAVTLSGSPESLGICIEKICDIFLEFPPRNNNVKFVPTIGGFGGGPNQVIGSLIGKGGCHINEIRRFSGANVQIEEAKGNGRRCVVVLSGTPEAVSAANFLINARIQAGRAAQGRNRVMNNTRPRE